MSPSVYLAVLAVGAAAVAIWLHVRFPPLGPASFTRALLLGGVAIVAWNVFGQVALQVLEEPSQARVLVALICLVFAPLAALFLTAIWIIRAALESMGPSVR